MLTSSWISPRGIEPHTDHSPQRKEHYLRFSRQPAKQPPSPKCSYLLCTVHPSRSGSATSPGWMQRAVTLPVGLLVWPEVSSPDITDSASPSRFHPRYALARKPRKSPSSLSAFAMFLNSVLRNVERTALFYPWFSRTQADPVYAPSDGLSIDSLCVRRTHHSVPQKPSGGERSKSNTGDDCYDARPERDTERNGYQHHFSSVRHNHLRLRYRAGRYSGISASPVPAIRQLTIIGKNSITSASQLAVGRQP